jgi:hypothetical protein
MPYENQRGGIKPIEQIANSPRIKDILETFKGSPKVDSSKSILDVLKDYHGIIHHYDGTIAENIKWLFSVDGSSQVSSWNKGVPVANVNYITYSAVIVDMVKRREVLKELFIDPVEFRKIEKIDCRESVLPGENTMVKGLETAKEGFRKTVYNTFCSPDFSQINIPFLDTLDTIVKHKNGESNIGCPYRDKGCYGHYEYSININNCKTCGGITYPTDWLRIHENLNEQSIGDTQAISEILQVIEALTVVQLLHWMESLPKENEMSLKNAHEWVIIVDGPLAIFGHPAELHRGILVELKRINEICKNLTGKDLAIVGLEKTGQFVLHFEKIDYMHHVEETSERGQIPKGTALILSSDYIKTWVAPNENREKDYGDGTYYGDKVLYKGHRGSQLVLTIPKFYSDGRIKGYAPPIDLIPRLDDILRIVEETSSMQFPNAIDPIISAHNGACIAQSLGKKVLTSMSERHIKKDEPKPKEFPNS